VDKGRSEGVNVTLLAQPTAEGFYRHVGFEKYGDVHVTSVDGDREFLFGVMAFEFSSM
jgi:predicted acetyltransferase